jgi:hypothetical protein
MPEILVLGVVRLSAYLQRNIVSLGVVDLFFPAFYILNSPWGNDRYQRCDAMDGQFEPDLVIAFSSASAPSAKAISASFLPMSGRANEVPRRYSPSYFAPAFNVGHMKSVTNSFFRSRTISLEAPVARAFFSRPSSSSPYPTSPETAIISHPG